MKKRDYVRENRVELKGILYADPVIKVSNANQSEYARITVKTTVKNHKNDDVAYFNSLTIWNSEQVQVLKKMKKESGISIVGRIVDRKIEENGKKRSIVDIYVLELKELIGSFEHVNFVELYGRIVAKPDIKKTANNFVVGNGTIAVRNKKSKSNEGAPDFLKVSLFGEVATGAGSIEKGKWTECEAIIKNSNYKNREGKTIYFTELIATYFAEKIWEDRPTHTSTQQQQDADDVFGNIGFDIDDMMPLDDDYNPFQ